ncbi:uncharacterized protein LOC129726105 isoform X1 [Wyeomyia smithii]|uniref:uncharacterized protein LOC129726105 isoform X1 n=1 Tax=Wyeomyia smithii TaxID=174621 RepID=UPI002467E11C|nr:uncharacterized protein LOC129726105 isoform X1 [Wyeomyia smithii]XP_055538845.1 uncharacterized protein LOC129726105 isoform X1 [Wyeomyia smithii]XP_055538921.1 uncharacterized protein LOC129726105 isoform X1 [Wyeomyia smithii]XP_055538956.1 uncharacterized protein LOC129726105 isoform X1 [Wyeomyia smithii]XP_055538973.1 uncharacterized protein LOC129726105 isoform X1 [Wyeomyia smithii]
MRNHYDTLHAMAMSEERKISVNGVKGLSPLLRVTGFDVIRNVPVDYMHNVLLGVCRQLCSIWFETPGSPAYIKRKLPVIDEIIFTIHPYVEASRRTRRITEGASWKANEWLHWLLHYSPICLFTTLPTLYYNHFLLLVDAVTNLLQSNLTECKFELCEEILKKFVKDFETLYGIEEMTYNVHLLTHLVASARDYGPLWSFALFPFEDMNGIFKSYIKGPNEPLMQIANRCILQSEVNYPRNRTLQKKVADFCDKINRVQTIGTINTQEKYILEDVVKNNYSNSREFDILSRLKYAEFIYKPTFIINSTKGKHKRKKHNDCYFSIEEGQLRMFGIFQKILYDGHNPYFLYTILKVKLIRSHFWKILNVADEGLKLIRVNNSISKLISFKYDSETYISKLQYKLRVD